MVARAGRYYGPPFKGYCRVSQGDPLSPTLFNMVVYAITHHCFMVVAATEEFM